MSAQQNRVRTMTGAGKSAGAPVPAAHRSTRKERAAGISDVETVLSNWSGNAVSRPAMVVQPQSTKQIAQIMQDHKTFPSPVRAVGANQSPTRCAVVDEGTIIDTRKLDRILKIGRRRLWQFHYGQRGLRSGQGLRSIRPAVVVVFLRAVHRPDYTSRQGT